LDFVPVTLSGSSLRSHWLHLHLHNYVQAGR
jgi:hypothetical protein